MYAKSVIVEFLTTKIPKVTAGNYNNKHIKEYVYEEYSSEQFQIQRIYSIDSGEVVFNVNDYTDEESRNTALKDLSDRLRSEEYDYAKKLDDRRQSAEGLLETYKDKLPKSRI